MFFNAKSYSLDEKKDLLQINVYKFCHIYFLRFHGRYIRLAIK